MIRTNAKRYSPVYPRTTTLTLRLDAEQMVAAKINLLQHRISDEFPKISEQIVDALEKLRPINCVSSRWDRRITKSQEFVKQLFEPKFWLVLLDPEEPSRHVTCLDLKRQVEYLEKVFLLLGISKNDNKPLFSILSPVHSSLRRCLRSKSDIDCAPLDLLTDVAEVLKTALNYFRELNDTPLSINAGPLSRKVCRSVKYWGSIKAHSKIQPPEEDDPSRKA